MRILVFLKQTILFIYLFNFNVIKLVDYHKNKNTKRFWYWIVLHSILLGVLFLFINSTMVQNKITKKLLSSNDHKVDTGIYVLLFLHTWYYLMMSVTNNNTKFWTTILSALFSFFPSLR